MTATPSRHLASMRYWMDLDGNALFDSMDLQIAELGLKHLGSEADPLHLQHAAFLFAWCHRLTRHGHLMLDIQELPSDLPESCQPIPTPEAIHQLHDSLPPGFNENRQNPIAWETPGYLYLRRLWQAERQSASQLVQMATQPIQSDLKLQAMPLPDTLTDTQIEACRAALTQRLLLLSGGPGTGKTFTIFQILRALSRHWPNARIQLLAPTGKAVARIQESIRKALESVDGCDPFINASQVQAATLHRFLRSRESRFSRTPMFPRPVEPVDVIIVDEASMVDLTLLHRLLGSLDAGSRLILMGDPFQLASVQPGAVFADACEAFRAHPSTTLELRTPFRFESDSALHELCEAIREGDAQRVLQCLQSDAENTAVRCVHPSQSDHVERTLRDWISRNLFPAAMELDPANAAALYARCMVLCAQNEGPFGVHTLNQTLLRHCRHHVNHSTRPDTPAFFWKPIMIRRNDPVLGLFNGDVGVTQQFLTPHPSGEAIAWFNSPDGTSRSYAVHLLPDHTDAFAYTVHKSQGSEANEVLLLLPERINPVLTRELLYTAVSRARKHITWIASEAIWRHCISTPTKRNSQLRQRIDLEWNRTTRQTSTPVDPANPTQ